MKVAYFTESLPPNTDGVVKTLCRLVETLESESVEFQFYSPVKPTTSLEWSNRVHKVVSLPLFLYTDYRIGIPYFHGIDNQLDQFKPDIIHVVSQTLLGMYGMRYAQKRKLKAVSSYHTHFVSYFSYYGFTRAEKIGWQYLQWFHNNFQRTYAPSPSTMYELEEKGIDRLELWQRGIELDKFSPELRNNELRSTIGAADKPVLLFVGRLVKEKDLDDLVEANNILANQGHDFKLVIVGNGPMKNELEQRLPNAILPGYQYGQDLSQWYASADIFVFPSTTETFGNVILEAFASGLPAVSVDKGGVAYIITDGFDGMVAKSNNPLDFSDKIKRLLIQKHERAKMSKAARSTARRYSWNAINKALLNSYEDVLMNKN